MTIGEFIRDKYRSWGLVCTDADMIFPESRINPEDSLTASNLRDVERAIVGRVPELLLRPNSVSELGVSISRADKQAIMEYYSFKCKELGIEDKLTKRNTIKFR